VREPPPCLKPKGDPPLNTHTHPLTRTHPTELDQNKKVEEDDDAWNWDDEW
jgi:hypothetical protein